MEICHQKNKWFGPYCYQLYFLLDDKAPELLQYDIPNTFENATNFFSFLKDFRMDMTISCTEEFQAQSNLAKLHYYILEKTILFATNPD